MIFVRTLNQIYICFRLCIIEIWSNRLRSVITSFGIFLGIASYLVNVAFIRGIDIDIKKSLEDIGGLNIITIKKKQASTEEETLKFDQTSGLKLKEIEEVTKSIPYTKTVLPVVDVPWSLATAVGKNTYVKPFAASPEYLSAFNYEVQEGRPLSTNDHILKQNVCLVGQRIVKELFPTENSAIGKTISVLNKQFTIVGIIKTDDEFSYKAIQLIFPYSFYSYRIGDNNNSLEEVSVELKSSDYAEKAKVDFTLFLKQKHRGIEDFEIESNQSKIAEMRAASSGIKMLLTTISILTLLIGGISIMNIMFAAIGDRIREIGIRKALGAKRTDIFLQFIIEAIMVSFVGGIPGLFLGAMIIFFPQGIFPYNPVLSIEDFCLAFFFTLSIGIISGLSPAFRAAKMQPIEALRY